MGKVYLAPELTEWCVLSEQGFANSPAKFEGAANSDYTYQQYQW